MSNQYSHLHIFGVTGCDNRICLVSLVTVTDCDWPPQGGLHYTDLRRLVTRTSSGQTVTSGRHPQPGDGPSLYSTISNVMPYSYIITKHVSTKAAFSFPILLFLF